jgi:hypothetical protein
MHRANYKTHTDFSFKPEIKEAFGITWLKTTFKKSELSTIHAVDRNVLAQGLVHKCAYLHSRNFKVLLDGLSKF